MDKKKLEELTMEEKYYLSALVALREALKSDKKAENELVRFTNEVPEFREQAIKAYNTKKNEIEKNGSWESKMKLEKIGCRMGIEQGQIKGK